MKIYDISADIFTAPHYDDDPDPMYKWLRRISDGSEYNLSLIGMTPHSGTHIDAPLHYIEDGTSAGDIELEKCCGSCTVVTLSGVLTGEDMDRLLPHCSKRLIIKGGGKASLELSAARVLTDYDMMLVGIDAVSIAFDDWEESVHRELLSKGTLILENLDLSGIRDGEYMLCALPLKLSDVEASPVRAVLIAK